jgi:hypothetical protein
VAIQTATATFTGAQLLDGDLPYIDIVWTTTYASPASYRVVCGPVITDSLGTIAINLKNKYSNAVRVTASDQFVGTVELISFDV